VVRLTGRPFSEQRALWKNANLVEGDDSSTAGLNLSLSRPAECVFSFGLTRLREDLHERIDRRVEEMFRAGIVEETRELRKRGLAENRTASQAIGYRQVMEYIDGNISLKETIELVKLRTRQYAKRQMTWFRQHLRWEWIELGPGENSESAARRVLSKMPRYA
jgi:tRNA dimethylallyltransferase